MGNVVNTKRMQMRL